MKAEIISFTDHGALLAQRLAKELPKEHISCRAWVKRGMRFRRMGSGCFLYL